MGDGGPVIRRARRDDLEQALELFDELDDFQSEWRVFAPREALREEAGRRFLAALDDPDAFHAVADQDGRLIGMAFASVTTPSSISDDRAAEVSWVIVREEKRRRGVAGAIMREVAAFARQRGAVRLVVRTYSQNEAGLRFWESLGFRARYVQLTAALDEFASRTDR